MKGYRFGVTWIAENDENGSPDRLDIETVKSYISVLLLADLFEKSPERVAKDVVRQRGNKTAKRKE